MRFAKNLSMVKNLAIVLVAAFLVGGIFLSAGSQAIAQIDTSFITNPGAIRDNDIAVDFSPAVPGPNQNVKITLSSFATDLNKAAITWSVDGKESLSGTGKTSFSFTTGDIGSKTEIGVIILV